MKLPKSHTKNTIVDPVPIQANIDATIMQDFKKLCLPAGWRQSIVGEFMVRFHAAIQAENIPFIWDDDIENKIATILSRMSFSSNKNLPAKKKKTA